MANKTLKFVLCYSSLCTKVQNGIHAEDCVQAIVSHQANIYQTDLNSQHTGTGTPKSEPNSYKYIDFAIQSWSQTAWWELQGSNPNSVAWATAKMRCHGCGTSYLSYIGKTFLSNGRIKPFHTVFPTVQLIGCHSLHFLTFCMAYLKSRAGICIIQVYKEKFVILQAIGII